MLKGWSLVILLFWAAGCSTGDDGMPKKVEVEEPAVPEEPEEEAVAKIVAHRGAWKEYDLPDNSIAALEKAIAIGSDASECDIQLTRDHQVIVFHDEKVLGKFIKDQTYEELSRYSLANGEKIPLLKDFLKIVVKEDFELWLDIKSLSAEAGGNDWSSKAGELAAEVIRNEKAQEQVAYIVGRKAVLDRCIAAIKGDWEAAYMNAEYTPDQFVSQGLTWANFTYSTFLGKPQLLNQYLSKDIKVSVYTIDEESAMDWFLGQDGIYAISTNYPSKLIEKR